MCMQQKQCAACVSFAATYTSVSDSVMLIFRFSSPAHCYGYNQACAATDDATMKLSRKSPLKMHAQLRCINVSIRTICWMVNSVNMCNGYVKAVAGHQHISGRTSACVTVKCCVQKFCVNTVLLVIMYVLMVRYSRNKKLLKFVCVCVK